MSNDAPNDDQTLNANNNGQMSNDAPNDDHQLGNDGIGSGEELVNTDPEKLLFKCRNCPFDTRYFHNFKKHKKIHKRLDPSKFTIICKHCNAHFSDTHGLWTHQRVHKDKTEPKVKLGRPKGSKNRIRPHQASNDGKNNDDFQIIKPIKSVGRTPHVPHGQSEQGEQLVEKQNLCAVCNDYARMRHYGALVCDACRNFFKRTVQNKLEYNCAVNKSCPMDKSNRHKCKYCRFQKCLAVGMDRENVRSLQHEDGQFVEKEKLCGVCNSPTNYQHYGALTCERCSHFFKRTINMNLQYVCAGSKNCQVDKGNRYGSWCQYCRFQKCLAVGMVLPPQNVDSGNLQVRRGLPSKVKNSSSSSGTNTARDSAQQQATDGTGTGGALANNDGNDNDYVQIIEPTKSVGRSPHVPYEAELIQNTAGPGPSLIFLKDCAKYTSITIHMNAETIDKIQFQCKPGPSSQQKGERMN